jgi:transcriptional regulator with XRE-family HTH domain
MFQYLRVMAHDPELTEEQVPEPVRIGRIFRNLRKAQRRTLQGLGTQIGTTHSFLSKVERGITRVDTQLGLIAPLAGAYGITPDEILAELYPDGNVPPGVHLALDTRKGGA